MSPTYDPPPGSAGKRRYVRLKGDDRAKAAAIAVELHDAGASIRAIRAELALRGADVSFGTARTLLGEGLAARGAS